MLVGLEDIPLMRAQHGVLGHILGGWAFSGTYILQSGQPYTPSQEVVNAFSSPVEDVAFNEALNNGVPDVVRPFVGSSSAPPDQVGIYAADACASSPVFSNWAAACNVAPGTLISVNSLNANGTATAVSKNQVRLIANGGQADAVFGTPYGAGRNILRDEDQPGGKGLGERGIGRGGGPESIVDADVVSQQLQREKSKSAVVKALTAEHRSQ